ncbi:MAG: DUF6493 family protein [Ancrocorticia sp.]
MTLARPIADAVAIFRELGWDTAEPSQVMDLPLGTPEQQRVAKSGLVKGSWGDFRRLDERTWGYICDVGVDEMMLAAFAIRVGVPAERAARVLRSSGGPWTHEMVGELLASRGPGFVTRFAASGMRATNLAKPLMYAFETTGAEVPEYVPWLEKWGEVASASLQSEPLTRWQEAVSAHTVKASYAAHLRATLKTSTPAPRAAELLIGEGVRLGWFDRSEACELVLFAMEQAQRPSDRLIYARVLTETLGATRDWLLEYSGILLSVASQGPDQVITMFVPLLLQSGDDVVDSLLIGLNAKSAKTKSEVMEAALTSSIPPPEDVSIVAESVTPLLGHKNRALAKKAQALLDRWQVSTEPLPEAKPTEIRGLWLPTPPVAPVPRFDPGPITSDNLTTITARLIAAGNESLNLDAERLLWVVNALASVNEEDVRTALRGVRDTWTSGLRFVEKWAGHQLPTVRSCTPESPHAQGPTDAEVAREIVVFQHLGRLPALLSTPSWDDFRIAPAALADRLDAYVAAGEPVVEPDLQLALPRIDEELLDEETATRLFSCTAAICMPDGTLVRREEGSSVRALTSGFVRAGSGEATITVGEVLAAWINDPNTRREPNEPGRPSKRALPREATVPHFPFLPYRFATSYGHRLLTIPFVPNLADAELAGNPMTAVVRKRPNGPVPATELLQNVEWQATPLDVALLAWQNGVLRPGVASARLLRNRDIITSLAARASNWNELAEAGMLSVIWPLVDDVVADSLRGTRIGPGVAELVELLARHLPEVEAAIAAGLTTAPEAFALPGVRELAGRRGSSRALTAAKALVALLPAVEIPVAPEFPVMSDEEFATAWRSIPDPGVTSDEATIDLRWVENTKRRTPEAHVQLSDGSMWKTGTLDWAYSAAEEQQLAVAECHGEDLWLRYEAKSHQLVMRAGRRSPERSAADQCYSHTVVKWLLLSQLPVGNYRLYEFHGAMMRGADSVDNLGPTRVGAAVVDLLQDNSVDPYRFVRELKRYPLAIAALYPVLTRSIHHASELSGKPPAWLVRVIDVATEFAPVLAEAGRRGLLSPEDARWPGLATVAESSQSPAAKRKARVLLEKLGLR